VVLSRVNEMTVAVTVEAEVQVVVTVAADPVQAEDGQLPKDQAPVAGVGLVVRAAVKSEP